MTTDELCLWAGADGVVIYVAGESPQLVAFRDTEGRGGLMELAVPALP